MNSKKISIIMGIYNCESTLEEAIDSILKQTYSEWHLIMCDDGSLDRTYNIANKYRDKYPEKITLIKNDANRGLNYTLNHCLKYADGEYIARMDGDDISLPTRFKEELDFLDSHKEFDIVSTPMIYFDELGDFLVGKGRGEVLPEVFPKGTPICHAPCMVRREAYEAVNGYTVSPNRLRVEDWDLWIRMYEKGFRAYELEKPLYKMRDGRDAYSRRKMKYRINESRVSAFAVKSLKLNPQQYIWVLRPIIVGLLPGFIYKVLHKNRQMFLEKKTYDS